MKLTDRKTGIDIIGDVPWGTHLCQFYKSKRDLIDVLIPYFKSGLENNEVCMWITSDPLGVHDAEQSLNKVIENLDEYFKRNQIEILDYSQWYTKSGRFEAERVLQGWAERAEQALREGFDGLRVTGNTLWLEKKDWKNFLEYEKEINDTIGQRNMIALCTYSLDRCGASEIINIINTHEFALIRKDKKWTIIENIERKRVKEVLKSHEQLRKFSEHLELVREKEKKLLAQEIHDKVAQTLVSIKINLSLLSKELPKDQKLLIKKIRSMTKTVDSAIYKSRKMYTELRPSVLNHLGLGSAIEWQAEEFQSQTGIECDVAIVPEKITLDWERSTAVFRIFQELLLNVVRHADATRIEVKLKETDGKLKLVVKDNGKGITEKQKADPESYGIIEMRERARFLEARFDIKGTPGKGTIVTVVIPLKTDTHEKSR
jgi:signal transduction histidine kinase